jgi:hypothetical protein
MTDAPNGANQRAEAVVDNFDRHFAARNRLSRNICVGLYSRLLWFVYR